jgi:hypothetical protein
LYPYFDGHFYENWELALFLEKVDQLGTQIFLPLELNKSLKTVQFNNQLLAKENKTLLAFNEAPQALGGTTYTPIPPWIHPLYESQNNKDLLFY